MQLRKGLSISAIGIGVILIFGAGLFLSTANANAQCGTQMSSCKNCHEVQAQKPVNADGTAWHQSHAFGDFCQFCHSGNVQSMVKEEAHKGMAAPLDDVQASCSNCHPGDTLEKANIYAATLGVKVGAGGTGAGAASNGAAAAPAAPEEPAAVDAAPGGESAEPSAAAAEAAPPAIAIGEGKIIDYGQRYEAGPGNEVSGAPVNWGDMIVIVLILALLIGGGAFVYFNEKRLRIGSSNLTANTTASSPAPAPEFQNYSAEVLALLPQLAQLTPAGRRALQLLLQDPAQASELLYSLSQIDADLLLRVRNLDEKARSLLLALSGS